MTEQELIKQEARVLAACRAQTANEFCDDVMVCHTEIRRCWLDIAEFIVQREELLQVVQKPCRHAIGTCEDMAGCHAQIVATIRAGGLP